MDDENTYEFQCMRAELLGCEKPDKENFDMEQEQKLREKELAEQEVAGALEMEGEGCDRTRGKLDELNTILSKTQQKINYFTGSPIRTLSKIFNKQKTEDEAKDEASGSDSQAKDETEVDGNTISTNEENQEILNRELASSITQVRDKSLEIDKKMTSHLDKLDELINKAERADMSMTHQTKQMKKFIK